jgi:hypothetical protein
MTETIATILPTLIVGASAIYFAIRVRRLNAELHIERQTSTALDNRVNTLRADNIELEREVGRIKAEKIAMKPKRDPVTGRFITKAKA